MRALIGRRGILLSTLALIGAGKSSAAWAQSTAFPSYNTTPLAPDMSGMGSTAAEIAARMTLGWNIGNSLEASGGETGWGNPMITPELIALVKASGFNTIRLPVAWNQYANQATAKIDDAWLARVRAVVQMCIDADLFAMVNIHWDGGWLENNVTALAQAAVNAKQKAFWEQIATHLRDFDERLLFASANEPNVESAEQMAVLHAYHQTFVDAVRATGGRNAYRALILQGPATDIEKTDTLWRGMPTDSAPDRLMAEVHFYTPWNFAGLTEDASWGNQFFYWGAGNHSRTDQAHNPTWGEEAAVDALFARMKRKFVDAGIPVIVGEYAATRRSALTGGALALHLRSRAHYHRYITRSMVANALVPVYWDNGGLGSHGCGIFDRRALTVGDQATLDAIREGAAQIPQ